MCINMKVSGSVGNHIEGADAVRRDLYGGSLEVTNDGVLGGDREKVVV